MRERRTQKRIREQHQVAITVLASVQAPELVNQTFFCPTADISRGGLRLRLHQRVPIGALLALRIAFNNPVRAFRHEGRVMWQMEGDFDGRPFAIGVQFTTLQEGAEDLWLRILERKETDTPVVPDAGA